MFYIFSEENCVLNALGVENHVFFGVENHQILQFEGHQKKYPVSENWTS